ncbi:hypothetical protein [uncultured Parolsenella sp.]|uniref:hypothetical protein n=1 Tax=uncultured Parolsenella sp. TaxID=2083008 RepID=UPI0027D95456|nr:hypothetical protein [uncultured Parolsenella sp.]
MELCGTYRIVAGTTHYGCPPLTSVAKIRTFIGRARGVRGRRALEKALSHALDNSASPAETRLALMLSLPLRYGGEGLGKPVLNRTLPLTGAARSLFGRDSITPDILFVVKGARGRHFPVEYESRKFHSSEEQAEYDERRRNTYAAMGMSCFLARPKHLSKLREFDSMVATVRKNIAAEQRPKPAGYLSRKALLHSVLAEDMQMQGSETTDR